MIAVDRSYALCVCCMAEHHPSVASSGIDADVRCIRDVVVSYMLGTRILAIININYNHGANVQ